CRTTIPYREIEHEGRRPVEQQRAEAKIVGRRSTAMTSVPPSRLDGERGRTFPSGLVCWFAFFQVRRSGKKPGNILEVWPASGNSGSKGSMIFLARVTSEPWTVATPHERPGPDRLTRPARVAALVFRFRCPSGCP